MKFNGKEILGMIHLSGGAPIERAIDEIKIYERQGLYGVIIENYHGSVNDIIYTLKNLPKTSLKIGINILPNEVVLAFDVAKEYNVDFIQFDYISGVYGNGKQLDIAEYTNASISSPNTFVMGGVWPKYYSPIKGSHLYTDLKEANMIADAVVVTGAGTGKETPLDKIMNFDEFLSLLKNKKPLIIGAGLTKDNVKEQMAYADGAIVGSAFKPNGNTMKMVDEDLVKEFMDELNR